MHQRMTHPLKVAPKSFWGSPQSFWRAEQISDLYYLKLESERDSLLKITSITTEGNLQKKYHTLYRFGNWHDSTL